MIRNPENLCMLCLLRKAIRTGSHFVPAGVLAPVIGKRDYEEAHALDLQNLATDSFYGRSNSNNKNPEQKLNHHVADYIFCNECENNLGKLESEMISLLDKTLRPNNTSNVSDEKINNSITLRTCHKLSSNITSLFIYSLIWRIDIQQRLGENSVGVNTNYDESLRNLLNNNIDSSIETLKKEEINFEYEFTIITCDDIDDSTASWVNPGDKLTNPQLFYIGKYLVLAYHNETNENHQVSTLPKEVLDKRFRNKGNKDEVKVLKVSKDIWEDTIHQMVEYGRTTWIKNMITNLSNKKKIGFTEAQNILQTKADEIKSRNPSPSDFFKQINNYYHELMSDNN